MPRQKNPKPQHHYDGSLEDDPLAGEKEKRLHTALDDNDGENSLFERSLSPSLSEPSKIEDTAQLTPNLIVSEDDVDNSSMKTSENEEQQKPEQQLMQETSSIDHQPDKPEKNSKNNLGASSSAAKTRRPATSFINSKVAAWLLKRFELRENSKTSASEVIRLYEKEKGHQDSYIPLQSYQVGQLLRRIFPGLQRCKITVAGKRVWVYKHLGMKSQDAEESDETAMEEELEDISVPEEYDTKMAMLKDSRSMVPRPSVVKSNDFRKHVKNSAILYNLLYPHSNATRPSVSTFRKINTSLASVPPKTTLPKNDRDESIIKWLRDNYEYADGYFVKSLNVLKKYNQGRQTEVRYLSQVGRIIKYVFPNARHLRRSLKGGKREWIYHNIRPKDHTEKDVWKGSKKNIPPLEVSTAKMRPSLVQIPNFASKILNNFELSKTLLDRNSIDDKQKGLGFFDRVNTIHQESIVTDSDRSDDGYVGNSGSKSESSSSPPTLAQNFSNVFYKHEEQPEVMSAILQAQKFPPYQKTEITETNDSSNTDLSFPTEDDEGPKKTLSLESQINRLKSEKTNEFSRENTPSKSPKLVQPEKYFALAEDLSMSGKDQSSALRDSPNNLLERALYPRKPEKNGNSANQDNMDNDVEEARQSSLEHNYSFSQVVDTDLRVKDFVKGTSQTAFKPSHSSMYENYKSVPSERPNGAHGYPQSSQLPQNQQKETIQWEDLSICDAHRFGWTLTPTLNNEIPPNYIEWILFEGQLLRDGQRVFRELKIYDDWSVSIHALGKKVHPDELGGITDLSRTKKSITKVFSTLASARSCRGLPALCLSDLCAHGVIVAKTEIWSSRESNCEELRHRAINCQVLYCENEEACPKCCRVIRMHSHNSNTAGGTQYAPNKSRFGMPPSM